MINDLKLDLSNCRRNSTVDAIHDAMVNWIRNMAKSGEEKKLPTTRHIAEDLGVARQTIQKVYRRLEDEGLISRESGRKIWKVKRRHLSTVKCIGILLPMKFSEYYPPTTEYGERHIKIYNGMMDRASELGFASMPIFLPDPAASDEEIKSAIHKIKQNCAGVIHLGERGFYPDPVLIEFFEHKEIPQVIIDCNTACPWIGSVTFDPLSTAQTVYKFLNEYGHSKICLVYHHKEYKLECRYLMISREDVLEPFRQTGIDFSLLSELTTNGDRFDKNFEKSLTELMKQANAPTAFWCRNDIGAVAVIKVLEKLGYRVPEDISVMGFGDQSIAKSSNPPLTTLSNPLYEIGRNAVSRLAEYMDNGIDENNKMTRVSPSLIIRGSVAQRNPGSSSISNMSLRPLYL